MAVRNFRYKIKAKPAYDEWTIISPWCRENIDAHGVG